MEIKLSVIESAFKKYIQDRLANNGWSSDFISRKSEERWNKFKTFYLKL